MDDPEPPLSSPSFLPPGHTVRLSVRAGAAVQVVDGRAALTSRRWLAERLVTLQVEIDGAGVFGADEAGCLDLCAPASGAGLHYSLHQPPERRGLCARACRRLRDDVAHAALSAATGLRAVFLKLIASPLKGP